MRRLVLDMAVVGEERKELETRLKGERRLFRHTLAQLQQQMTSLEREKKDILPIVTCLALVTCLVVLAIILPVAPAQLMRPGIGQNVFYALGDCLTLGLRAIHSLGSCGSRFHLHEREGGRGEEEEEEEEEERIGRSNSRKKRGGRMEAEILSPHRVLSCTLTFPTAGESSGELPDTTAVAEPAGGCRSTGTDPHRPHPPQGRWPLDTA